MCTHAWNLATNLVRRPLLSSWYKRTRVLVTTDYSSYSDVSQNSIATGTAGFTMTSDGRPESLGNNRKCIAYLVHCTRETVW